jgi:hypothetical protein
MSAYINRKQVNVAGIGVKPWIPLNRWSEPGNYSVVVTVDGSAEYTVQSTVDPVNKPSRNDGIYVCDVENAIGITVDQCFNITSTPLEAIRVEQTLGSGTLTVRVMQNGSGF